MHFRLIYFLFLSLLALFSCKKETEYIQIAPVAVLKGNVVAYDGMGKLLKDQSGLTVTLEGVNWKKAVVTDASGDYLIPNVPTSTYDLVLAQGLDEFKIEGVKIIGGDTITRTDRFFEPSPVSIYQFSIFPNATSSNGNVGFDAFLSIDSLYGNNAIFIVFFNDIRDVSKNNFKFYARGQYIKFADKVEVNIERFYQPADIAKLLLVPGNKIYAIAYAISPAAYYSPLYYDIHGKVKFQGLADNPSLVQMAIIPY